MPQIKWAQAYAAENKGHNATALKEMPSEEFQPQTGSLESDLPCELRSHEPRVHHS